MEMSNSRFKASRANGRDKKIVSWCVSAKNPHLPLPSANVLVFWYSRRSFYFPFI